MDITAILQNNASTPICQSVKYCVSTPADFILLFRTLPNRLVCIILLNCYR